MNGRPLKFQNPQELEDKITEYFETCKTNNRPLTISGLAFHLGTNRQTLINYSQREEFFDTIKRAKACIEAWVEEQLFRNGQVAGVIFNLKNNFRWKDEVSPIPVQISGLSDEKRTKIISMFRKVEHIAEAVTEPLVLNTPPLRAYESNLIKT